LALACPAALAEDVDERARWITGLPTSIAPTSDWQAYADAEEERWRRTRETRVAPMRELASKEIAPYLGRDPVVLYPFAGPDALCALALFGTARRYVLMGLEPVGVLPDPVSVPAHFFSRLSASMSDVHRLSFFRTQEMASDFKRDGVVAALLATIVR